MAYNDFRMDNQWLPFTPNRSFAKDPRIFVAADGMHFTTHDGRRVIDGISSLWCVGAGHNRKPINEAIKQQLDTLDYSTAFSVSNDKAFRAAEMIAALAPGGVGTLEEVIEVLSWKRLDLHSKPVIFLNLNGFWEPLLAVMEHSIAEGMTPASFREAWVVCDTVEAAIEAMQGAGEVVYRDARLTRLHAADRSGGGPDALGEHLLGPAAAPAGS